jgi:hypothetical protein
MGPPGQVEATPPVFSLVRGSVLLGSMLFAHADRCTVAAAARRIRRVPLILLDNSGFSIPYSHMHPRLASRCRRSGQVSEG